MPVDLLGPWYRDTNWPRIWWNLNIQTLYLPVYAANQLMLGESFIRFIDGKRDNFVRNAKDIWGVEDAATVSHTTCYEGLRGDGSAAPDHYIFNDSLLPKWEETLASLMPYPVDENGFRVGSGVSFTKSHRHWSHLLMVHPLQIMDFNNPESRELTIRSIRH